MKYFLMNGFLILQDENRYSILNILRNGKKIFQQNFSSFKIEYREFKK